MKLKMLLSLLIIAGMVFVVSCGSEEKQPELETLDSVDELIEELDEAETHTDTITAAPDTSVAVSDATSDKDETVAPQTESVSTPAKPGDYTQKPLEGTIVSLNHLIMGGNGKVSKAEAQDLVAKGNLILFRASDGAVYFVYNEDGTFAGKRLAGYANNSKVGMLGKSKVINGMNVFIMNMIESM
ncbi:MAG: hypothetical protein WC313_02735 [Candidatus Kapaibacterium sp.]|jgi:hypothetical protein|nr:hypothetical protein [Candidatus Kapabacteria bacterium]